MSSGSKVLVLISMTFLWELECNDGTNVGLAAGRYSGNSRPDLYRTPHALQRLLGPIGPALHCGVFVISQCMHFLTLCDGGFWFIATGADGSNIFTFFFLCSPPDVFGNFFIEWDSTKLWESKETTRGANNWGFSVREEVGDTIWIAGRGLKVAGRGRLLLARWRLRWVGLSVAGFPTEEELLLVVVLLSRTETGLEVWKWLWDESLLMEGFCFLRVMPPLEKESSTNVESHSSCTMSSYWERKQNIRNNKINNGNKKEKEKGNRTRRLKSNQLKRQEFVERDDDPALKGRSQDFIVHES